MNNRKTENIQQIEEETKRNALRLIASQLQRPDQLEKVEQLKKKYSGKKDAANKLLNEAVQSNIDGVKTGLLQLGDCLEKIRTVKSDLSEIHTTYDSIKGLKDKLIDVARESAHHQQLAACVETLYHITKVPETVAVTRDYITNGKYLLAHRNIVDLEASRDQLLLELHKRHKGDDDTDYKLLKGYFSEVSKLSEQLCKQIDLTMSRPVITAKREANILTSCLRIIEREERLDGDWEKRREQFGYRPEGRPKEFRKRAINKIADYVENRVLGCQLENREQNKMWLVRYLELIRKNTLQDLKDVKAFCEPCFPKTFNIIITFAKLYHTSISQQLLHIKDELEGNEIFALLNWVALYDGEELMGHPQLREDIPEDEIGMLLSQDILQGLQQKYMDAIQVKISEYLTNAMTREVKDWMTMSRPDADGSGFYYTQLPSDVLAILQQNLEVAAIVGPGVAPKVLELCMDEMSRFALKYRDEITSYRTTHLKDKKEPPHSYLEYMMAQVNNSARLGEIPDILRMNHDPDASEGAFTQGTNDRYHVIKQQFREITLIGIDYLKEELFSDIRDHVNKLVTRDWMNPDSREIGIICATVEDFKTDFEHIKIELFVQLMFNIYEMILLCYLKNLTSSSKRLTFKSADERRDIGDQIIQESDQLVICFEKLAPGLRISDEHKFSLPTLAELIKLTDTSLVQLELSAVLTKYPDVKIEHLENLLMLRGDTSRTEAKKFVEDVLADQPKTSIQRGLLSRV